MRISLQIDPPQTLNLKTDTSMCLAREAAERGFEVFWHHPKTVSLHQDGEVSAEIAPLFKENSPKTRQSLSNMDVILLRQNPPFDMAYIANTHALEQLSKTSVLNNPKAVRENPEKLFPLQFKEFLPATLISADADDITAFAKEQGEIVLKPLFGYGGMGVFKINHAQENLKALLETLLSQSAEPLVAQAYIPAVEVAEKRIILIDGKIEGAFQRKPEAGEIRSNTRIGGTAYVTTLTAREKAIAEAVGSVCKAKGLTLVGLDVIGDFLNEINITSPTGLMILKELYGTTPEKTFWDAIAK